MASMIIKEKNLETHRQEKQIMSATYYECLICEINSLNTIHPCPCPMIGCGANKAGILVTNLILDEPRTIQE